MGKILENRISRFDGGVTNDSRDTAENVCQMVTNFDITNPKKLTPYRESESGNANASIDKIENFCVALDANGTDYILYGLGVVSGQTYARLLTKNTFSDGTWTDATTGASASLAVNPNLLVYYKKVGTYGTIYGARGGATIWSYNIQSAVFTESAYNIADFTKISQGLVHSKDDIMYFGADNTIIKNDNGSFSVALTLPSHYYITSICEYGNLLAIGVSHLSGNNSRIYLWDRDSTLTTLSETIDWGSGSLKILEEIDGKLIGISIDSYYDGTNQIVTRFNDVITFKYLSGNTAITFKKIIGTTNSQLPIAKQKINSKLHFMMSVVIDGIRREGVWSLGRSVEGSPFALVHERTPNNNTALAGGELKNFFYAGDYLFIASTTTSATATYQLVKTNDSALYTATSIYETVKYSAGDIVLTKQLIKVGVMFEFLPSGATVVLKYKKDEEILWTQIFSHATADSLEHSTEIIESSGNNLPQFKEIKFRIESTVGAEITGLKFKVEIIDEL